MKKIDRATYKGIKRKNREEMNSFLTSLYRNGFRDGVESSGNADFRIKLSQVLNNTKGIGPVMYDRIMGKAKEME